MGGRKPCDTMFFEEGLSEGVYVSQLFWLMFSWNASYKKLLPEIFITLEPTGNIPLTLDTSDSSL